MTKLDDQITRSRKKLECCLPGDAGQAMALHSLAVSLNNRFMEANDVADLDEAISFLRSALDLRPVGHPRRSMSLHYLALYLSEGYDKWASRFRGGHHIGTGCIGPPSPGSLLSCRDSEQSWRVPEG